jgi:tRNA dimethylallyltransferase
MKPEYELLTILGPTACGKTPFAAQLAHHLNTEIISADSRQVYRRMDIGSGKDLDDYIINGYAIPYHLIDVCDPGTKYNVFRYQHDFFEVYNDIRNKGKIPILCGGTGMYIEAVLKGYKLLDVPPNDELRGSLKDKSLSELEVILSSYKTLHNKTDVDSVQRAIRAIEIEEFYRTEALPSANRFEALNSLIIGLDIDRELRRRKISKRLKDRINSGMVAEVEALLNSGIKSDDLLYYGLEYKYVTKHVLGELTLEEMVNQLETAIHQFAKRQMTWFRGMERRGLKIHWINSNEPMEEKIKKAVSLLSA